MIGHYNATVRTEQKKKQRRRRGTRRRTRNAQQYAMSASNDRVLQQNKSKNEKDEIYVPNLPIN